MDGPSDRAPLPPGTHAQKLIGPVDLCVQVIIVVAFGGSAALLGASVCLAQTFDVYCALVPWLITGLWYNYVWMRNEPADTAKYLKFNCPKAEKLFAKVRCCGTSTDTTNNSVVPAEPHSDIAPL
eukprot:COSAG01_NODE_4661_length_4842_cov_1.920093_1_plen_125_part_00